MEPIRLQLHPREKPFQPFVISLVRLDSDLIVLNVRTNQRDDHAKVANTVVPSNTDFTHTASLYPRRYAITSNCAVTNDAAGWMATGGYFCRSLGGRRRLQDSSGNLSKAI